MTSLPPLLHGVAVASLATAFVCAVAIALDVQFLWFRPIYGGNADVDTPEFWFAMLAGFCISYRVNWALIKSGVKERMA